METIELTEDNYCDQKSVTMEFTFEEHDLLKQILIHSIDSFDIAMNGFIYELPKDSEIRQRYEMLEHMSSKICDLWKNRFGNSPYNNN